MHKQIKTWKLLLESLEKNKPAMLLYVLESKGSSPGRQGFFMSVNASGEMEGSIGGGIMEHKFVEMAKEKLGTFGYGLSGGHLKHQVHDKAAASNQSGMICSGEQTLFLYPVREKDKPSIQQIVDSLEQNKNGSLRLSPQGISFSIGIPAKDFDFNMQSEEVWTYTEKTGYKNQLFIIGGGHCALAFSKLMRQMDFYITLFEEREGLNTLIQNEAAHEIMVIDDYSALSNLIASGPNQYIVVMTFGYRTDDLAIRGLLGKQFRYFGVLGSKKKIDKLFADYRTEGIPGELLEKIHAPVGINISSQTPEEIAISIAAEIIAIKNK